MKKYLLFFTLVLFAFASVSAKQFTLVIDAGHGGKDPGALGQRGREKDINLSVALAFGNLVKDNMADVQVVYTRETDVFVTLQDRSKMANKANGDLFVCIHANSSKARGAYGAETYTIGLGKSDANFEVAKRENSVILLEDGYKETYQGFDPTSPESYIMFEFMQSKFSDQSIEMAAYTQDEFSSLKRYNRGVRQENFWVLHQTKMPSVLIELGFVSNPDEEKFLLSADGQTAMASAIYNAFAKYKHEYDRKSGSASTQQPATIKIDVKPEPTKESAKPQEPVKEKEKTTVAPSPKESENKKVESKEVEQSTQPSAPQNSVTDKAYYCVQLLASKQEVDEKDARLKGYKCDMYFENNYYKYTYGLSTDLSEIVKLKNNLKAKFPDVFIVAFYQGKRISVKEASEINK